MPTIALKGRLAGSQAARVHDYIVDSQKAAAMWISPAILSERSAAAEILALAEVSASRSPLYHVVISWPVDDQVSVDAAIRSGQHLLGAWGLDDHQAVIAAHGDAAHRHVHMLFSRLHPDTRRLHEVDFSPRTLIDLRSSLERDFAWKTTEKGRADVSRGARAAETWNSDVSFERFLRERINGLAPTSWRELDTALGSIGVEREAVLRGQKLVGYRFIDRTTAKMFAVRASRVGITPTFIKTWGQAPLISTPPSARDASYGELAARGALPSILARPDIERLRGIWRAARASSSGIASQFGYWWRRQASHLIPGEGSAVTMTDTNDTLPPASRLGLGAIAKILRSAVKTEAAIAKGWAGETSSTPEYLATLRLTKLNRGIEQLAALREAEVPDLPWPGSARTAAQLGGEAWAEAINTEFQKHLLDRQSEELNQAPSATINANAFEEIRTSKNVIGAGKPREQQQPHEHDIAHDYEQLAEKYSTYRHNRLSEDRFLGSMLAEHAKASQHSSNRIREANQRIALAENAGERHQAIAELFNAIDNAALAQEDVTLRAAIFRSELKSLVPMSLADFAAGEINDVDLRERILAFGDAFGREPEREPLAFIYDAQLAAASGIDFSVEGDELVFTRRHSNKPAFVERDDRYYLSNRPDERDVAASLALAAKRFDNRVSLSGDAAFIEKALREAVDLGIVVTNPELQQQYQDLVSKRGLREKGAIVLPAWAEIPFAESPNAAGQDAPRESIVSRVAALLPHSLYAKNTLGIVSTEERLAKQKPFNYKGELFANLAFRDVHVLLLRDDASEQLVVSAAPAMDESADLERMAEVILYSRDGETLGVAKSAEEIAAENAEELRRTDERQERQIEMSR